MGNMGQSWGWALKTPRFQKCHSDAQLQLIKSEPRTVRSAHATIALETNSSAAFDATK